jgi:hypothetical protein
MKLKSNNISYDGTDEEGMTHLWRSPTPIPLFGETTPS